MQRENSKHSARVDDELAHETEGLVRGNRPSRSDPFLDPEPPADDDPVVEGWNAPRTRAEDHENAKDHEKPALPPEQ
ncbi:hypothetical protein [Sciscionella sediminilitoris]|uniref:hypothetical protein n=1 Tax=Sciscionella sediminilitoris TaxID=1445613 RepID=UPI00055D3EFB|nr:hypothetical protein [Sciscionella sp. SE31]